MEAHVKSQTHQGITTIEFFHPQSNSLPKKILEILAKEIHFAGTHTDSKVIILKSAGDKIFCAGASFDELVAIKTEAEGLDFFSGFADVINVMRKCPKFIIARVQGKCIGGGVGLVATADYAIATNTADIKLSELAVGIGPFVVGPAVERKVGVSAFCQMTINASEWHSAEWAKTKGLYADIFKSAEEMDKAIAVLADKLAKSNPEAMMMLKKIMWEGTENWDTLLIERAEMSGKLVLSEFTINAINKFKQKA